MLNIIILFTSLFFSSFIYAQSVEFVILITSYNNENYYYRNLESVIKQKSELPYKIIYVNDCSTDNTGNLVDEYITHNKLEDLVTVIHNKVRVGNLTNVINAVNSCDDDKVIVIVDGDDALAHDNVLTRLEQEYNTGNIWITFGNFLFYPFNRVSYGRPIPEDVIKNNSFRENNWPVVHLRTFKAGLFKKINIEDLKYEGSFEKMNLAPDCAYGYPMLEMASNKHIAYIPDVLYLYNYTNPLSEFRSKMIEQEQIGQYILSKPKYSPLTEL